MAKSLLVGCLILFVVVGGLACTGISLFNSEVSIRNQAEAQQDVCKLYQDKMWKVVAQQAQIAETAKDAFMKIYPKIMSERYSNARGGALMSFIQEQNPNFDLRLYEKLSVSVEAQREGFFREQSKLRDLARQHKSLLENFPGVALTMIGRTPVQIQLITSDKTDDVYRTGKENDINLFQPSPKN